MTRVLKTRLKELLPREDQESIGFTAESIGIAPNTLRTMLRDDWDQLARDSIERVCDRYGFGIGDLFELVAEEFWSPFDEATEYTIIRGTAKSKESDLRDESAATMVALFLKSSYQSLVRHNKEYSGNETELVDFVKEHNCLIVGSPRSNQATEVILSKHFGARPFTPEDRAKIPVKFVFPRGEEITKKNTTAEPWSARAGNGSGCGLIDNKTGELIVEADWLPRNEYLSKTIRKARDCGLVLVVNKPFGTTKKVKTILIAGFSGIGTEGAARALVRDFRDLEPLPGNRHVLGVLEATYKKTIPNQDNRILERVRWKFLSGGRKKIPGL